MLKCYQYDIRTSPAEHLSCGCCHSYSQQCVNKIGYFECKPCMSGFVGSAYGGIGCALPVKQAASALTMVGCDGVLIVRGGKILDACGICDGDNSTCLDCAGVPNGPNYMDECKKCRTDETACKKDCTGIWGGSIVNDGCGICAGDNSTCADCAGIPYGKSKEDRCETCDANEENDCTLDCKGIWGGVTERDYCKVISPPFLASFRATRERSS